MGIALGQAFAQALGDMRASPVAASILTWTKPLILCISRHLGPLHLNWDIPFAAPKSRRLRRGVRQGFWLGFAAAYRPPSLRSVRLSENSHHILEAAFKGAGRALADAVTHRYGHQDEIPSTEGLLV